MPNSELGRHSVPTFGASRSEFLFRPDGTNPLPLPKQFPDAILTPTGSPRDIFVAGRQSRREGIGSQAFRLEYGPETPRQSIYDDVVTYLGEYRLQASETFYDILFSREQDGFRLRDMHRGTSVVETAEEAMKRGHKLSRRIAERDALVKEEEFLAKAQDGDITIQASPPGEIDDGNYGFIFIGKVEEISADRKLIHKNAIRINDATIEQYNQALSRIIGKKIKHKTAEEVIADPHLLGKTISYPEIMQILQEVFQFKPSAWEKRRNEWIIDEVEPYIHHLIDMIHSGQSPEEAFAFLEKIENKALDLKSIHKEAMPLKRQSVAPLTRGALAEFNERYDYKPPVSGGSCGSTDSSSTSVEGGSRSSVSFTTSSSFMGGGEDEYGSLDFECPNGHSNSRPRGELIPSCTTCGVSVGC